MSVNPVGTVAVDEGWTDALSGCVSDVLPVTVVVSNAIDRRLAIISCLFRGHSKHVWLLLCLAVPETVEQRHVKLAV